MLSQLKGGAIFAVSITVGFMGIILLAGCNKAKPVAATNSSGPVAVGTPGAPAATGGRGVFEMNCMKCHTAGGPTAGPPGGGKGMMKGPDLARVGQDPKHTRDWIMAYVRNPREQKPDSKMPPFGNRIADADLTALADYLLSLKGS
jgi:mono/diheme cytochrome c family protein